MYGRIKGVEFSEIHYQDLHEPKGGIRGVRSEIQANLLKGFAHEESPTTSYDVCEHSTTQSVPQHGGMPTFLSKEGGRGETPKEGSLGEYLQEYESQSERFKEHLSFPECCQLREEISRSYSRRNGCMQHTLGRFSLATIDGSPKDSAKSWVKKLNTYF